ncbi:hypothetical protein GGI23_006732, partial [Coemansia sp. RSA 2559]
DHQTISSSDDAADGCGGGGGVPVTMVDSGAFDTTAASTSAEMFSFGLDGDFSFLANLIAANGDGSSNNSSSALASEGPTAAGDTQPADIFSLVHLPGGPALSTIDGRGRSDPQQ